MDLGLQGKCGIVVGGSRGIGKAIAMELAGEGVDIAIAARNPERLRASAEEIAAATGRRVYPLTCNVTSRAEVDTMVSEAVGALGSLHILVNSGSAPGGSPTAVGYIDIIVDADFLDDFNVKYLGALRCSRAIIPHLQQAGWGRIVNISGLNARIAGNLSGGARNTSLVHFTKTLANQLGRHLRESDICVMTCPFLFNHQCGLIEMAPILVVAVLWHQPGTGPRILTTFYTVCTQTGEARFSVRETAFCLNQQ